MRGTWTRYLLVAAAALVGGLFLAGTPVQSVLPFVALLACPLMMVFMMRSMGGHSGDHGSAQAGEQGLDSPTRHRDDATSGR